jgi:chromosome segregation ATPase
MASTTYYDGLLTGDPIKKIQTGQFDFSSPMQERELSFSPSEMIQYQNQLMRENDWRLLKRNISESKQITTIILSGVNIDGEGLKNIGEIISSNSQIKNLKIEWNYLDEYSQEFDFFCDCVTKSSLIYLSLNNNKINSTLSRSLQKIIVYAKNLQFLDLRWNEIGNEGAKLIVSSLGNNKTLLELNLIGNKINGDTLRDVNEHMIRNKDFQSYLYSPDNVNYTKLKSDKKETNVLSDIDSTIPLKIIEKEKSISNEFKSRYDVQLIENAKLEKQNKEYEKLLELERQKINEMKKNFDQSVGIESSNRKKAEDLIINIKEENSRLKIENENLRNEIDNIKDQCQKEKNSLNDIINQLKGSLERKDSEYSEKYNILNNEFQKINKTLNNSITKMVNESETLKKDFNVKNKNSYDEFDKKLRENEDEIQKLKEQNQILQKEISDLKKNSLDEKMDLEMQYKSREARLLDDEQNKNLMEKEGLLKRIKVLENTKEDLEGKLNDKKGSNQNLKSNPRDNEYVKYENQISELRSQNAQLLKNNGDLESEKSSMLIDLKAKENLINQYKNKASEIDKLRDNLEREKNSYLIKKEKEFKKEKESFEIEKGKLNDKIRELENEVDVLRGRLDKFEEKREMIKEQMKRTLLNYVENNKI